MTEPLDLDAMLKHGGGASYTDVLVLVEALRERDAEIAQDATHEVYLRDEIRALRDERDVALAEIARLRAPPGADAMERVEHLYHRNDRTAIGYEDRADIAYEMQQYGDERAAAAIEEAEAGPARTERDGILYREGQKAGIEEVALMCESMNAARQECLPFYIRALAAKPGSVSLPPTREGRGRGLGSGADPEAAQPRRR